MAGQVRGFFLYFPVETNMALFPPSFMVLAFIFWLMLFSQKENVEGTYRVPFEIY